MRADWYVGQAVTVRHLDYAPVMCIEAINDDHGAYCLWWCGGDFVQRWFPFEVLKPVN